MVFVSGTTATGKDGAIVGVGSALEQSRQVWQNIEEALKAVGASLSDVVRTRMYVVDIAQNGPHVAQAHAEKFAKVRPTSTMVGIERLWNGDMLVEFEVDCVVQH